MSSLVIPESVSDEILSHAREGAPREVCGILAGTRSESGETTERRVETRLPAENVAEMPRTRYEIDPQEQLELMERIEAEGREIVGFYHSHPRGPAEPSATDAAQATWPDRSYVIVSLGSGGGRGTENGEEDAEPTLGSWRWTGEEFVAEELRVEG